MPHELLLATRRELLMDIDASIPRLQGRLGLLPDSFTLSLLVTAHDDVHAVVFQVGAIAKVTLTNSILVLILSRRLLSWLHISLVQNLSIGLRARHLSFLYSH